MKLLKWLLVYSYSRLYKKRIVCFGTSLTAGSGWVRMLRKELKGWAVINGGKGAMNSDWGLDNIHRVLKYKPTDVLIEFCINDSYIRPNYSNPTLEESKKNMDVIFRMLLRHNIKPHLLLMNPPFNKFCFGRNPAEDRPLFNTYQLAHITIAEKYNIPIIDIYSRWKELKEEELDSLITDRLHPTKLGSKKITVPTILEYIGE